MTVARRAAAPVTLVGHPRPRIAPPLPARADVAAFRAVAADLGIDLMPWQETSARYTEATGPDGRHLFREVCEVVARQNGKTEKLVPLIVGRLRRGRRIVHTAQNRDLPREVFERVADIMAQDLTLFPQRNGRTTRPRFANGQEEIKLNNGGRYKIVAPTRGGARGGTNDDVIIDEVRELDDFDFISAVKPTMTVSPDPQMLYLSNAGEDSSIVLNSLRERADKDPRLAYLEWSAAPERASDDRAGWVEANPAIGHLPTMLDYLGDEYLSNKLGGTLGIFETEHLCRWVVSKRAALVDLAAFALGFREELEGPRMPVMGVSMDPSGSRASAAIAWQRTDGTTGVRVLFDETGDPVDLADLGEKLRSYAATVGVKRVAFDPMTDAELAKYVRKAEPISGQKFANASAQFVNLVLADRLRWTAAMYLAEDLSWTSRKPHDDAGAYTAVRARDDRPVTAALAAIRAVWLASGPSLPKPRVL